MAEKCFEGAGRRSQAWARRLLAAALRPGSGRPRRILTVLALTFLASGCYTYAAVSPAAAPPGSSVRVRVDPAVHLSLGAVPLPGGGRVIHGRVLQGSTADTLLCSVALGNGDQLTASRGLRGTVPVPVTAVELLEVRRLSRGRTIALVAAGAVLGFAVLEWAFNITNPSEGPGGEPGGGDNARIPLFRLHW